jgi:hypothetical protein
MIQRLTRDEFANRFYPTPGQHVGILAATGGGKTTLATRLLIGQPTNQLSIVVDTKPRNLELDKLLLPAGFKVMRTFPPMFARWSLSNNRRIIVRTVGSGDFASKREAMAELMANTCQWCYDNAYRYGGIRLYIDELRDFTYTNQTDILQHLLTHGRSQGLGVWGGSQRPRFVPLEVYSQSSHILFGCNPDLQDRKRLSDVGGFNPSTLQQAMDQLRDYEFLAMGRRPKYVTIVGKS